MWTAQQQHPHIVRGGGGTEDWYRPQPSQDSYSPSFKVWIRTSSAVPVARLKCANKEAGSIQSASPYVGKHSRCQCARRCR